MILLTIYPLQSPGKQIVKEKGAQDASPVSVLRRNNQAKKSDAEGVSDNAEVTILFLFFQFIFIIINLMFLLEKLFLYSYLAVTIFHKQMRKPKVWIIELFSSFREGPFLG